MVSIGDSGDRIVTDVDVIQPHISSGLGVWSLPSSIFRLLVLRLRDGRMTSISLLLGHIPLKSKRGMENLRAQQVRLARHNASRPCAEREAYAAGRWRDDGPPRRAASVRPLVDLLSRSKMDGANVC